MSNRVFNSTKYLVRPSQIYLIMLRRQLNSKFKYFNVFYPTPNQCQ